MRAVSNGDSVLIQMDGMFSRKTETVAKYNPGENTLEMFEDYAAYLPRTLEAVRRYKEERHLPAAPVRVEYW